MATQKNKVKFNISNAHYAILTQNDNGEVSFGTPVPLPGLPSGTPPPGCSPPGTSGSFSGPAGTR